MKDERILELLKKCYNQIFTLCNEGWGDYPDKKYLMEELGLTEDEYTWLEGGEEVVKNKTCHQTMCVWNNCLNNICSNDKAIKMGVETCKSYKAVYHD